MDRHDTDSIKTRRTARAQPTGLCWCGCGGEAAKGKFFLPNHDRKAEAARVVVAYGSIADMLADHGFGPENSVVAAAARSAV